MASAVAGGGSAPSKSATLDPGTTKKLEIPCETGHAISTGFQGEFSGLFENVAAIVSLQSRLSAGKGVLRFGDFGNQPGKAKASALCGKTKLVMAKDEVIVPPNETGKAKAQCPAGTVAISGGFKGDFRFGPQIGTIPVESYRSAKSAWSVTFFDADNGVPGTGTAYVYCAKGPAPKVRTKIGSLPSGGPQRKTTKVDAKCKNDEHVVSGGYRSVGGPHGQNVAYFTSKRQSARTWRVAGANSEIEAVDAKVYAYCVRN